VYLGGTIRLNEDVTEEVKSRIGKATGNSEKNSGHSVVPCSLKAKIHHACVRSLLLYGSESWPIK
jgi:hypothetical protein